ncbi:MAG TPA: AAA family ATPase [Planctomycetes bacterium]|nr:AAA family ATPase [Planctomycetota bacterium]
MRIVYMTIGCIGSGKSTWARNFVKDKPKTKIVSPDAFRKMLNGEYEYHVEQDDIITESCFDTARHLLDAGYDVIIDCGNLTRASDRRSKWKKLPANKFIAVIMPQKDVEWHVNNRLKKPHWDNVDWHGIAKAEKAAYEAPADGEFDTIIHVKEF